MTEPLRILVVDDDVVDRMAVHRALKAGQLPADIEDAGDAAAALDLMRARAFDCVLLDYMLPDGDGLTVVRDARAAGVRVPIVILTGQGDEEIAVELMKAGASDYLPKAHVTPPRLAQSVRTAVRVHEAEVAAAAAERERLRLLELEQAARRQAEEAQEVFALLSAVGTALADPLDVDRALDEVARLVVPQVADRCEFHIIEDEGRVRRAAAALVDGGRVSAATDGPAAYRLEEAPPHVAAALRGGEPSLSQEAAPAAADETDPRARRSLLATPLVARGRVLGVISLATTVSGRRLRHADLALAQEVARRVALAVEGARHHRLAREAEESLRRQLALTEAITGSLTEGVVVTDASGVVTHWNGGAERLYGWSGAEAAGRHVLELHGGGASREEVEGILERVGAGGTWTGELVATRKDGEEVLVRVTAVPLRDSDGRVVGVVGVSEPAVRGIVPEERSAAAEAEPPGPRA